MARSVHTASKTNGRHASTSPQPSHPPADVAMPTMPFGSTFKGQPLDQLPSWYTKWLLRECDPSFFERFRWLEGALKGVRAGRDPRTTGNYPDAAPDEPANGYTHYLQQKMRAGNWYPIPRDFHVIFNPEQVVTVANLLNAGRACSDEDGFLMATERYYPGME